MRDPSQENPPPPTFATGLNPYPLLLLGPAVVGSKGTAWWRPRMKLGSGVEGVGRRLEARLGGAEKEQGGGRGWGPGRH